jgi:hypothetical protein
MEIINLTPDESDYPSPVRETLVTLDDAVYRLVLTYMDRQVCWYMSIYDSDDNTIISGQALHPGAYIFPRRVGEGRPSGMLYLLDLSKDSEETSIDALGKTQVLIYYSAAETAALKEIILNTGAPSYYSVTSVPSS